MFLELIAVFVAGFAGAGVVLLLTRLTGGRLPRWMVPAGAGIAMLATAISSEYAWFSRTAAALPDGMVVAHTGSGAAPWRPWTYVFDMTDKFVAADMANVQTNKEEETLHMVDLYFFGRWQAVQMVEVMVDCENGRRADPAGGDGAPPVWRTVGMDDPLVSSVCEALEAG